MNTFSLVDHFDLDSFRISLAASIEHILNFPDSCKDDWNSYTYPVYVYYFEKNVNHTRLAIAWETTEQGLAYKLIHMFGLKPHFDDYRLVDDNGEITDQYSPGCISTLHEFLSKTARNINDIFGLTNGSLSVEYEPALNGYRFYFKVTYDDLSIAKENYVRLMFYDWNYLEVDLIPLEESFLDLKRKAEYLIERLSRQSTYLPLNEYTVPLRLRKFYEGFILFGCYFRDRIMNHNLPPKRPYGKSLTFRIKKVLNRLI